MIGQPQTRWIRLAGFLFLEGFATTGLCLQAV